MPTLTSRPSRKRRPSRAELADASQPSRAGQVSPAALRRHDLTQSVQRRALIGMRVHSPAALRANPAPLAHQEGAAKQVRPHLQPVIPPLVQFRANAAQQRFLQNSGSCTGSRPCWFAPPFVMTRSLSAHGVLNRPPGIEGDLSWSLSIGGRRPPAPVSCAGRPPASALPADQAMSGPAWRTAPKATSASSHRPCQSTTGPQPADNSSARLRAFE